MKKTILLLFVLTLYINVQGQVNIQCENFKEIPVEILGNFSKIGVDTSSILNKYESDYLNFIFKSKDFDFTNKKIGFITEGNKKNKKEYFKEEIERFHNNYTPISSGLYLFNASQKAESGGYDAVIVYWSKVIKTKESLINILKRGN